MKARRNLHADGGGAERCRERDEENCISLTIPITMTMHTQNSQENKEINMQQHYQDYNFVNRARNRLSFFKLG